MKFTFELRGDGKKIPAGEYEAETIDGALRQVRRNVKHLEIPGWILYHVEKNQGYPAVKLFRREKLNGLAFLKRPKPEFK